MGYAVGVNSAGVDTLEPQHSDVVCFESHADESDSQRHQAIMLNNSVEGAFPPSVANCQLRTGDGAPALSRPRNASCG